VSTRQYARLLDSWLHKIGLDPALYGTHSLRRTKATLIYKRTRNLRAVQLLLGHTKIESTVRYLGVEVNDALEIANRPTSDEERQSGHALPRVNMRAHHALAGIVFLMSPRRRRGGRAPATQSNHRNQRGVIQSFGKLFKPGLAALGSGGAFSMGDGGLVL
jgi:hypothetical protein